jgi:hypothetical protein
MHQPLTADASERATVVGKIKTQRLLAHACSRRWLIGNFEPVPAKKSDKNRWTVNRRNAPWQNHNGAATVMGKLSRDSCSEPKIRLGLFTKFSMITKFST